MHLFLLDSGGVAVGHLRPDAVVAKRYRPAPVEIREAAIAADTNIFL